MAELMTWATLHPFLFTLCIGLLAMGWPPLVLVKKETKADAEKKGA